MTQGEAAPREPFDVPAALHAAGIGLGPVENTRRLVPLGPETDKQVVEFYSSHAASRLLAIPSESESGSVHRDLTLHGLPVLPRYTGISVPGVDMLQVPPGTWALGNRLHVSNLAAYSGLFWQVAYSQRQQYDNGMGVIMPTEQLRVVDRFVFTPDLNTDDGQRLAIIPPYTIDHGGTPEVFAHRLIEEMQLSGAFNPDEMGYLSQVIMHGAVGDGEH
jgi:hypothetical protein